jgi:hypothetical protein
VCCQGRVVSILDGVPYGFRGLVFGVYVGVYVGGLVLVPWGLGSQRSVCMGLFRGFTTGGYYSLG